tara:strand:- start:821 stop:1108 length:288 start_codon:yes stop_codon:yes gene_type:complete
MKLIKVETSSVKNKRLVAIFSNGSKKKKVNFGLRGGSTYLDNKDKKKRSAYRARHKVDLKTKDPMRAGYLSYYLLWGDSTSLEVNIKDYKKKFNL